MANSDKTPTIGVNPFVLRQTAESEFTHHEIVLGWKVLPDIVAKHWDKRKPGYREGVCLVPIPPEGFFCGVVKLKEGDKLVGEYKARRSGEEPRKTLRVTGAGKKKLPCVAVDVVLYSREVLQEGNEECTGEDWDIISINGRLTEDEQPIEPMTLIANHFELDGGTATGMSPEEFEAALRESVLFWKNKALLAP